MLTVVKQASFIVILLWSFSGLVYPEQELTEAQRNSAIYAQIIIPGLSKYDVLKIIGYPTRIGRTIEGFEVWYYGDEVNSYIYFAENKNMQYYIYIKEDRVFRIEQTSNWTSFYNGGKFKKEPLKASNIQNGFKYYDGDGKLVMIETDKNRDGKVDYRFFVNRKDTTARLEVDEDCDGVIDEINIGLLIQE